MKNLFTLLFTLLTLTGFSQTNFYTELAFDAGHDIITFDIPSKNDLFPIWVEDLGSTTSNGGINTKINTVDITFSAPGVEFSCTYCSYITGNSATTETVYLDGAVGNAVVTIHITLTGTYNSGFNTFPGNHFAYGDLTAYTETSWLPVTVTSIDEATSNKFVLNQNYPNPFSNSTTVEFVSPNTGSVDFTVYDMTGKTVDSRTVNVEQGLNTINYGENLPSGVYFYNVNYNGTVFTKRLVKN